LARAIGLGSSSRGADVDVDIFTSNYAKRLIDGSGRFRQGGSTVAIAAVVPGQTIFETAWHFRLDSWTVQVATSHNFVSEMRSSSNPF
jgi:hypothetical protein